MRHTWSDAYQTLLQTRSNIDHCDVNMSIFYDSFSDKVLDQVTKRLEIQKSFKHVFSDDFAFLYIRGKPALNISTKFAIFD